MITTNAAARQIIARDIARERRKKGKVESADPVSPHFLISAMSKITNVLKRKERSETDLDRSDNCLYRRNSTQYQSGLKKLQSMEWINMSERWRKSDSSLCELEKCSIYLTDEDAGLESKHLERGTRFEYETNDEIQELNEKKDENLSASLRKARRKQFVASK